jgi:hypothetical protein
MGRRILFLILLTLNVSSITSQGLSQTLKGIVTDKETNVSLPGANIFVLNSSPPVGAITDAEGKFKLTLQIGRISLKISFLGYEDLILNNILIASGKEVELNVSLLEKAVQTSEVIVRSDGATRKTVNQMAIISTNTIRTDDAMRYAGGFYDPSRIVNSFAGVVTSNSDVSNDIIIRGNSSRGLLWRLEGIEIPNPNHFSDGQGGSGGAFSAITSNVIDNFDFYTGAFPAEFGNAISGVMDLNLRKGNSDKHEYAFQTGMIGAEISMEGPFSGKKNASFLLNARYTNFKMLSDLKIIDLGETNFAPRTKDLAFNFNFPGNKAGTFNLFGVLGSSQFGKIAVKDFTEWSSLSDQWEEMEKQSFSTIGIKHLFSLPDSKTYIKSVLAFTTYSNSYYEGYIDSSYVLSKSYYYNYYYPSIRASLLLNHKFNAKNTIRAGININHLAGDMSNFQQNAAHLFDTLVSPTAEGYMLQGYIQWKYRPFTRLEVNSGLHILESAFNRNLNIEPRLGLRCMFTPSTAFILGFGLHSRSESLAVYNALIKSTSGRRENLNSNLDLSKAIHFVGGLDVSLSSNIQLRFESYIQYLFNIPIVNNINSQYSTINSAERLPDAVLTNEGTGVNKGIEVTIERSFIRNYYFLLTGSLFSSWYVPGDHHKYNTYYNTKYVSNILLGRDFYVGKDKRNSIGINAKANFRGGYRFTPVDEARSIKSKRVIYNTVLTYNNQLPYFMRVDAGINFRRNHPKYSWIIMLDVQNVTNRKNVFKRRFSFENGKIISNDIFSLGIVPVFNFRVEF